MYDDLLRLGSTAVGSAACGARSGITAKTWGRAAVPRECFGPAAAPRPPTNAPGEGPIRKWNPWLRTGCAGWTSAGNRVASRKSNPDRPAVAPPGGRRAAATAVTGFHDRNPDHAAVLEANRTTFAALASCGGAFPAPFQSGRNCTISSGQTDLSVPPITAFDPRPGLHKDLAGRIGSQTANHHVASLVRGSAYPNHIHTGTPHGFAIPAVTPRSASQLSNGADSYPLQGA